MSLLPALNSTRTASNYGSLDAADVRRLSFISFADVVHAEHAADHASGRDSLPPSGPASIVPLGAGNRSPSPMRSPLSSHALSSFSAIGWTVIFKRSRHVTQPGWTQSWKCVSGHSPPTGGELTIETMRQALRKTGSGDLSGARSQPLSAVGGDDGAMEQPLK